MTPQRRRRLRGLLLIPLFGGIFWATALFASTVPGLLVLGVNVHGLGIASYAGDRGGSLAPLSPKILSDVSQDSSRGRPASLPAATPSPDQDALPSVSATATTVSSARPRPSPSATPTTTPSLPALPTVTAIPSVLPIPSPTPTPTPTPTPASISGQVVDAVTHAGIAAAQVTLSSGGSTTTDINGNFSFAVSAGTYTLTATAIGYNRGSQTATVKGGQNVAVTIKLVSVTATGGIKGSVTSYTTAASVVGAVVSLSNGMTTVSDLSGVYSFPVVPYGNYTISAAATGYVTQSQPVTVRPGHATTLNFALIP